MLDQVFVSLKHWLLGYSPAAIQPAVSILLTILPILLVFLVLFALTTVLEDMCVGQNIADVVVILGSIDIVMGEVDR